MRAALLLAALLLPLSGCDSGGDADDDGGGSADGACAEFGFRAGGTITADADGQPLRAECYNAFVENGLTFLSGYEVGGSASDFLLPVTLVIDGETEGTYRINGPDPGDASAAQFSFGGAFGGEAASPAESGEIQVTEYSDTRLRGTFSFVTTSGVTVSDGVFDVDVSGLL